MIRRLLIGFAAVMAAHPATAQSWDFRYDYGAPVFSYGYGETGSSFTAFPNVYDGGCAGVAVFACRSAAGKSLDLPDLPTIGVNLSDEPIAVKTFHLYPDELYLHPGVDPDQDVIVRFTAPREADYHIYAVLFPIDDTFMGNGITFTTAFNDTVVQTGVIDPFGGALIDRVRHLKAGDILWYGVGNNGDVYYDSTRIAGSITAVPEPASWGLMILGFGAVGGVMRRRSVRIAYCV